MAIWISSQNEELDCRKCTDQDRIEKGCEKDSPFLDAWKIPGQDWSVQRCPLKIVQENSWNYLEAYRFYKAGYLPNAGGWMDQSIKFLAVLNIISSEVNKHREEAMKGSKEK